MTPQDEKEFKGWGNFCSSALQEFDGASNFKTTYDFTKLTKKFGKHYIAYLKAAYEAKDEMTDEEFCRINGNVPVGFLNKIRG